jgi:hypothetical protein
MGNGYGLARGKKALNEIGSLSNRYDTLVTPVGKLCLYF